jgi:hypothetical protein
MKSISLVLRHYNRLKPINCTVISGDTNKMFTVELTDNECKYLEMVKGDPVLIGRLNEDDSIQVIGGSVIGSTQEPDKYIICSNELAVLSKEIEKRQYERHPTSLLGEIKQVDSNKKASICLKDFSYSGIGVYSTGDFEVEDSVEVQIYLSNTVVAYDGTIIRKTVNFGRNEYGISFIHRDKNSMYSTQSMLNNLVQSEKDLMYKHLLSSKFKI